MARSGDNLGPYTLVRKVGRGGFGEVWLAEKKTRITTTEFALKLAIEENPDIEAIQQEAELWKQASGHPNVLPIIEADIYEDYIVIVSEFARGGSLEGWLKTYQGAARSTDVTVEMISGILAGLEHLHSLRIIHRDLKPANILLQGNRPRLADFGLARVLRSGTFSQTVAGTPDYMAPEAFLNERTAQTDLWAVGVMLYQMVTGYLPFPLTEKMSPWQKMTIITSQEITPPPETVPKPLREVIIQALQKNPEQRYQSASEMLAAIVQANYTLKYKIEEAPPPPPTKPDESLEETKPLVTDSLPPASTRASTEPLVEEPDSTVTPVLHSALTKPTLPSPQGLQPGQTGTALMADTEPDVLVAGKPKRAMGRRWGSMTGVLVLAIGLTAAAGWYLSNKNGAATVNPEGGSPSPVANTPAPAAVTLVEVATYYLEIEQENGASTRSTSFESLSPGQGYRLHFTPRESGYLYLLAPWENREPRTYLTGGKPIANSGVKSNTVEAGKDFVFPVGGWMEVKGNIRIPQLTILFSREPLKAPAYLLSPAGRRLADADYQGLRRLALTGDVATSGVVTVSLTVGSEGRKPVIFDIN